jgi:hypothetical protein
MICIVVMVDCVCSRACASFVLISVLNQCLLYMQCFVVVVVIVVHLFVLIFDVL